MTATQTRVENAAYIIERIESLGIEVQPTSRVMVMLRTLELGYLPYDHPKFPIALQSVHDMYQLRLIVSQLDSQIENPEFKRRAKLMLKDATMPQDCGQNTPGRDTQFELYLAAVCLAAGLDSVTLEEPPDITCSADGLKFGIAAKRLKTLNNLEEHIKKGADQVRRSGCAGIVALDLTGARNPTNEPILSQLQSQLHVQLAHIRNYRFFNKHHQDIFRWVAGTPVRAVLVFELTLRVTTAQSWSHDGMMCWLPTTQGDEQAEHELELFSSAFLQGMPNLEDLTVAH